MIRISLLSVLTCAIILLEIGCGSQSSEKESGSLIPPGYTKVQFKNNAGLVPVKPILANGLFQNLGLSLAAPAGRVMVYAVRKSGELYTRGLSIPNDATPVTMILKNGDYNFYGIVHSDVDIQNATIQCGTTSALLPDPVASVTGIQSITIPLTFAGCNSPQVAPGSFLVDGSLRQFYLHNCGTGGSMPTIAASCGAGCAACPGPGSYSSYTVSQKSFELTSSGFRYSGSAIDGSPIESANDITTCLANPGGGAATASPIFLPFGNVVSTTEIASPPTTYDLTYVVNIKVNSPPCGAAGPVIRDITIPSLTALHGTSNFEPASSQQILLQTATLSPTANLYISD